MMNLNWEQSPRVMVWGGDKLHVRSRRRGRIPLGIDVVWFMGGGCPFYREG